MSVSTRNLARSAVPLGARRYFEVGQSAKRRVEQPTGVASGFALQERVERLSDELSHRQPPTRGCPVQGLDLRGGEVDLCTPHTAQYTSHWPDCGMRARLYTS